MRTRKMTCIACPRGCLLEASFPESSEGPEAPDSLEGSERGETGLSAEGITITGNFCPKGETYGIQEILDPRRMLTSTVSASGAGRRRVPVRTADEISKSLIFRGMDEIHQLKIKKACRPGDVIVSDFLHTGINLIATGEWDGR